MKTPGFGQKAEKYFVAYVYPDLSLSQLDGVGKNLLGYLHYLLHPQGVTFEDAWNLILLKMNKVLSGLFCWTTESRVCREVGKLKFLQIRCTYIYLLLKHSKFRLYHSWYFIKNFLQCWCLDKVSEDISQCDVSLLLICSHIRNWSCGHYHKMAKHTQAICRRIVWVCWTIVWDWRLKG